MDNREHGTIEFWNQMSYGFIRSDRADAHDIFFHISEFELPEGQQIKLGDRVTYEVTADRRDGRPARVCAKQVRIVNGEENEENGRT